MSDGEVEIVDSEDSTDSAFDSEMGLLTTRACEQTSVCFSFLECEKQSISAVRCQGSSSAGPPSPLIASDVAEAETQKAFSISDLRMVEEASQEHIDSSISPFAFRAGSSLSRGVCPGSSHEAQPRRLSIVTVDDSLPPPSPLPLARRLEINLCETTEPDGAEARPGDAKNSRAERSESSRSWREQQDMETLQADLPRLDRRKRRIRCHLKKREKTSPNPRLIARSVSVGARKAGCGATTVARDVMEAVSRRPKRRRQKFFPGPAKDGLPSLALDTRELSQWASMAQVVPTQERLEADEFTGQFRRRLRFARQRDVLRKRIA